MLTHNNNTHNKGSANPEQYWVHVYTQPSINIHGWIYDVPFWGIYPPEDNAAGALTMFSAFLKANVTMQVKLGARSVIRNCEELSQAFGMDPKRWVI